MEIIKKKFYVFAFILEPEITIFLHLCVVLSYLRTVFTFIFSYIGLYLYHIFQGFTSLVKFLESIKIKIFDFFAGIFKPEVTFSFINVVSSRNLGTVIYFLSNLTLDFTYNITFQRINEWLPICNDAISKMCGGHLEKKVSFSQPLYQISCLYHALHNYVYNISHYHWSLMVPTFEICFNN